MSVLIEALCLVVPNRVLDISYPGGSDAFIDECAAREDVRYAITDGTLTAVSIFDPAVGTQLADALTSHGIVWAENREAVEFNFADMETGPTLPCSWLSVRRHPHGFMLAWHSGQEEGQAAAPGDWDPSSSWRLQRFDIRDDPERGLPLGEEDGFETILDLQSGHVNQSLSVSSPVVPIGRGDEENPERWALQQGLEAGLATIQQVLQRVGIPYSVDREIHGVLIPFACDVNLVDEDGDTVSVEIRQHVIVRAGPGAGGVTCTAVLPLRVSPVNRDNIDFVLSSFSSARGPDMHLEFDEVTGTVALVRRTHATSGPLDMEAVERAVATISPDAGQCYEQLHRLLNDPDYHAIVARMELHELFRPTPDRDVIVD